MGAPDVEPARAATYVHGHHESVLRSHRWRTVENSAAYLLPVLVAGARVLDVGCGPGTITVDFARRVMPGEVVGIDAEEPVIADARALAAADEVPNVRFEPADVYSLPFADGAFDVVHAHQVLQHLADPVAALREMGRVCAPGGTVAARDSDYEAMTWHPRAPELDRWLDLYREVARRNGGEPDAGRHLLAWAHAAGFADVEASASAWCFAIPDDRQWWGGLWADRVTRSRFATEVVDHGLATEPELARIARGWREWAAQDDGWFAVLHGEVRCLP